MKNYISINNKIISKSKALISIQDRGFRFGDGVFETCLIFNRVIYNVEAHLTRLVSGLNAIKICYDSKDIVSSCYQLIKKNNIRNGYLRIMISRGIGSVGYLPTDNIIPNLVIETVSLSSKPQLPIKLFLSSIEKLSPKSLPINYKLMQGMNSILARIEAFENNCFDAVMFNNKKQICETSSANIFWIKDDILYTPHQDCGCLQGTIKAKVMTLSPIKVKSVKAKLNDLIEAQEVFITNVAIGVLAVDKIANTEFRHQNYSKKISNLLTQDIKDYVKKTTTKMA